jgi:hypothetical protein
MKKSNFTLVVKLGGLETLVLTLSAFVEKCI